MRARCIPLRTASLRQVFYLLMCRYRRETNALDVLCSAVHICRTFEGFVQCSCDNNE